MKCRVVLCIRFGVGFASMFGSRTLDGPQAASFEVPELGKRDPALGTPKVASQSQTGLSLCQVVGSCYDVLLWEWFLGGACKATSRDAGCERDEVLSKADV